ncbi:hypothetical protein J6590_096973 [Homalodisca vitripennis]|nr:hypothetical protein J6590_096973 [Homalodisca vitripennis]
MNVHLPVKRKTFKPKPKRNSWYSPHLQLMKDRVMALLCRSPDNKCKAAWTIVNRETSRDRPSYHVQPDAEDFSKYCISAVDEIQQSLSLLSSAVDLLQRSTPAAPSQLFNWRPVTGGETSVTTYRTTDGAGSTCINDRAGSWRTGDADVEYVTLLPKLQHTEHTVWKRTTDGAGSTCINNRAGSWRTGDADVEYVTLLPKLQHTEHTVWKRTTDGAGSTCINDRAGSWRTGDADVEYVTLLPKLQHTEHTVWKRTTDGAGSTCINDRAGSWRTGDADVEYVTLLPKLQHTEHTVWKRTTDGAGSTCINDRAGSWRTGDADVEYVTLLPKFRACWLYFFNFDIQEWSEALLSPHRLYSGCRVSTY